MNAFEGILEDHNGTTFDTLSEALKPIDDLNKKVGSYFAKLNQVIEVYLQDGIVADLLGWENWEDVAAGKTTEKKNSTKENIQPKTAVKKEKPASPIPSRPRRNAFREASQNINQQSNISLNMKLRRPKDMEDNLQNVYIKKEKLTICNSEQESSNPEDAIDFASEVKVKTETEEMPAPSRPAPRRKKRKGSERKIKQEKEEKKPSRDSDVIVQDATVAIVNLDSSDDEVKTLKEERPQQKSKKRSRTSSIEEENRSSMEKRSKSSHDNDEKEEEDDTKFEDAQSTITEGGIINATFVAKPAENINATVVVDHPKCLIPQTASDLMTDDESVEEVKVKAVQKQSGMTIPKLKKPIFSPFEQSPVKKKVQAFEKLQEEASAIPTRSTRTKTRALAKKQQQELEELDEPTKSSAADHTSVREKAKIFTPTTTRFLPQAASTTLKTNRVVSSRSNSNDRSVISAKSASALKASQAEYREREKKRREKEQETLKKRDALLQLQMEEKKRKREEKQLKAQQQREALEKEKLKVLEAQRLKDERHKQLVAEQEERKLRQREEQEKKRQMAKMRALEEKKREEERRLAEQKKTEEMATQLAKRDKEMAQMVQKQKENKKEPIYMRVRAPLLPTPDCYDSDDDRRPDHVSLPRWCNKADLKFMQKCASSAGERIKNSFFSIQAQTPDLQDIFETIEARKLKRTSSAVWDKPPRFTMLPVLENHDETEEFDEDFDC